MPEPATSPTLRPGPLPDLAGQAVRALVLYALAEFQLGHASNLWVQARGRSFSVADDGRGHAIGREIGAASYLDFIYTHLDYPFATRPVGEVQLQGIGISLVNAICGALEVRVHKRDLTLVLAYRDGRLAEQRQLPPESRASGNTVAGTLHPHLQVMDIDESGLEAWLQRVAGAHPGLRLHFNDRLLSDPDAAPA